MDSSVTKDVETGVPHEAIEVEENENSEAPLSKMFTDKPVVTIDITDDTQQPSAPEKSVTPTVIISEVVDHVGPGNSMVADTSAVRERQKGRNSQKRFYPGDVVVVKEDKPLPAWQPFLGTVLKPAQSSEMTGNEDKGSSVEINVHWDLTNRITLMKPSDIALVDRSLFRGQKVENNNGDTGIIVGYETTAAVQINGTNDVIENVPLHRLRPISPHVRGQEVLLNGWVGVITGIKRNVWFKIDGGPVFYLEAFERDGFTRSDPFWGLGVACPGMRTRLAVNTMKKAIWASNVSRFFSRWFPIRYLYAWAFSTIVRTEVVELEVKWLQPAPGVRNHPPKPPNENVVQNNLAKLLVVGTPSAETIGIGSVRKLKLVPLDVVTDYKYWLESFKKAFIDENKNFMYPKKKAMNVVSMKELVANNNEETPVRVLQRNNSITVQWQNGTVEKVPAVSILRISPIVDDGEFPAGLTVAHVQKDTSSGDIYGIVMDSSGLAKSRSRKVNVRWIVDGKDDGTREESVFDIQPHSKYSMYHRGTILFPREPTTSQFRSAVVIDVNIPSGKMVVIRSSDNLQDEVFPHQVIALAKRCHWSFFTRTWTIDAMIPPPYQLELAFSPAERLVDVSDQRLDVLVDDPNNPQDLSGDSLPTLWDEPPFELLGFAPESHRYYTSSSSTKFGATFAQMVEKEMTFLKIKENITEGIWIRSYENRMDLLSVLMVGPSRTPYEDGILLFEMQLPADFPSSRPAVHFVSYTLEIHPLLSYDGNVCVSSIPWDFTNATTTPPSYILNFLTKLQEILFTPTPYFASPQKKVELNTESGRIKCELYNQGVFVRVLDSIWNMLQKPHEPWGKCIHNHFASVLPEKIQSVEKWMMDVHAGTSENSEDEFTCPLISMPEGLQIALSSRVVAFKKLIKQVSVVEIHSVTDATADSESHSIEQEAPAPTPAVVPPPSASNRLLTPISELTEPSSTSTFGNKRSNVSVSSPDEEENKATSFDSLSNIKPKRSGKGSKLKISEEVEDNELSTKADSNNQVDDENKYVVADVD